MIPQEEMLKIMQETGANPDMMKQIYGQMFKTMFGVDIAEIPQMMGEFGTKLDNVTKMLSAIYDKQCELEQKLTALGVVEEK